MLPHKNSALYLIICLLGLFVFNTAQAVKPVYSGGKERAAIRGYDPVAYFTQNKPVKGNAEHSLEYLGATWLFSTAEHKALFQANPEKYAPQYGGYCAYAVARKSTASIKPQYFTIHKDKLYLNYSKSVNVKWVKDKDGYIDDADSNWPALLKK